MEADKVVAIENEPKLCTKTEILLLKCKSDILELKTQELSLRLSAEEKLREFFKINEKFSKLVLGVQKEYPGYELNKDFVLVKKEKEDAKEIPNPSLEG